MYIASVFCFTYLYKQTFAIPGSFFLVSVAESSGESLDFLIGNFIPIMAIYSPILEHNRGCCVRYVERVLSGVYFDDRRLNLVLPVLGTFRPRIRLLLFWRKVDLSSAKSTSFVRVFKRLDKEAKSLN